MFIGVDPGKEGGVVVLNGDGRVFAQWKMPDGFILADHFEQVMRIRDGRCKAYLERVGARPGQGVTSMFTFGEGYGLIQGLFIALRIPYELVTPFTWQRTMHEGISRKKYITPKERSLQAARQTYPNRSFILPGCRKPHMGIVDALLIAEFGRRKSINEHYEHYEHNKKLQIDEPKLKLCKKEETDE